MQRTDIYDANTNDRRLFFKDKRCQFWYLICKSLVLVATTLPLSYNNCQFIINLNCSLLTFKWTAQHCKNWLIWPSLELLDLWKSESHLLIIVQQGYQRDIFVETINHTRLRNWFHIWPSDFLHCFAMELCCSGGHALLLCFPIHI